MFFMARATDPTLPGLRGRRRTTATRSKPATEPGDEDGMSGKIPRYLEVAVPLPVRGTFTYRVPADCHGSCAPGARAVVPVGRRLVTGVIVATTQATDLPEEKIREAADLPDESPVLTPEVLSLARWASRYYVAPEGSMHAAALPPGIAKRTDLVVHRVAPPEGGSEEPPPAARALLARIPEEGIRLKALGVPRQALRPLERAGLVRLETVLKGPRVTRRFRTVLHLLLDPDEARAACARAPRQREVIDRIVAAGADGCPTDVLRDVLGRTGEAVRALLAKGAIRASRVPVDRKPVMAETGRAEAPPDPTPEQAAALDRILPAVASRQYSAFLLMGVTGSGKTEVYLRAIEACLASGRNAMYLVPEIALTALLARNLRRRLGDGLAILHSSLGPGARFDEWRRARQGRARIVLGARSAVLAPLADLGLVVVDEEQDASYKQEDDPRYNARSLALVRAREAGAVAILGSATPSAESYHGALAGRFHLLRLTRRILERPMARVRILDMRERFEATGREELISDPLRDAVRDRLGRGEQAILLLNRRGWSPFALCRACGATEQCRRCSVSLTWHRRESRMLCHYCGYWRGRPVRCGTCGSDRIALTGAGTERLEDQLADLFPEARIARLDRDTARGRRAGTDILAAFERGETNLLVGTQMVAKGHDFPGVTIVGVIGADSVLAIPEFRSAERTFQLLTQVAGRSGRGVEPGEVLVQAWHCDHYAMQAALKQDYAHFYEKEIRFRRIMKYPPFTAMANLVVHAASPEAGVRRARQVAACARDAGGAGLTVLGPSVAPLARIKDRYRYQILVKAASRRGLSDALNEMVARLSDGATASPRDLVIDVDPVSLV